MAIYKSNKNVSANFTRPANTTTYAAGDVVNDSASAGTVMTFSNCARDNGGGGYIVGVQMTDYANVSTAGSFELWIFNATVTADNDNAVFTPTDVECDTREGVIYLNISTVGDATSGAGGNRVYQAEMPTPIPFVCADADDDLYGVLVVRNAYVPVSAEKFVFKLKIVEDIR